MRDSIVRRRAIFGWSAALVGSALAGCHTFTPPATPYPPPQVNCLNYQHSALAQRPRDEPPASNPATAKKETLPIDLASALRLADENNPDIALARERVKEALAREDLAEALWLPSLEFSPNYMRHDGRIQRAPGEVINTQRSSVFGGGAAGLAVNPAAAYYTALAARQVTSARQAGAEHATNSRLLDVALAYLDLLQIQAEIDINTETIGHVRVLLDLTSSFERSGKGVAADTARTRVELNSRERTRAELLGRRGIIASRLAQLLRLAPDTDLAASGADTRLWKLVPDSLSAQDLVVQALQSRPDLAENRALITAALERWRTAKVLPLVPTLRLTYSGGVFGGGQDDFVGYFGGRSDVTAALSWQMAGLGFADRAEITRLRSQYTQTVFEQDSLEAAAAQQVVAAHRVITSLHSAFGASRQEVVEAEDSYRLNEERIRRAPEQGRPIELLQAIQALASSRQDALQVTSEYNRAQFRLFTALGFPPVCALQATPLPAAPGVTGR